MVHCTKHSDRRTRSCHMGLMPFVARHASLPTIVIGEGDRLLVKVKKWGDGHFCRGLMHFAVGLSGPPRD